MSVSLQAHYLSIEWQQLGRARAVTVAPESIEIEEQPDGTWTAETQVFNGLCPWVGLRLEGALACAQPAFEEPGGALKPMLQIEDGQGGHWWVQNDGWDTASKRHWSALHRVMGRFTIVIGPHRLLLNNIVDELDRAAVEDYLRDFQDDLVWLVLGFSGATGAIGGEVTANKDMVDALDSFASASRRVLDHPARHVREVQIESRPARLRPNVATFRQYLRNPAAQRLTGRGAEETPNIADNRYLRHMVQVCAKLAAHVGRASERHARRFEDRARGEDERSAAYHGMTHRKVDPVVFDHQMAELKKKLDRITSFFVEGNGPGKPTSNWEFRPTGSFGKRLDQMFYQRNCGPKAVDNKLEVTYSVLQVPEELAAAIKVTQGFCDYYSLDGIARATIECDQKDQRYRKVTFTSIYGAMPITAAVANKEEKRRQLEMNDWQATLTAKERQELQQEALTARLRGSVYEEHGRRAKQAATALGHCHAELRAQDLGWQGLGVVPSPMVPMGVRFSQSPEYTACKVAFTKVTSLAKEGGLSEDALDAIGRISVLHASALYERWCLVKILSILMEDYQFEPEAGWQERLVRAVTGRPQSMEMKLHRGDLGWTACLEVQPELRNGRRPDFRLRFLRTTPEPASEADNYEAWGYPSRMDGSRSAQQDGLVMDAKFRSQWRRGELGRTLTSLVMEKEYGQEGDRVFILHPAPHAILKPTSPLAWGRDCDYGQNDGNAHRQGVIYLAPGTGGASPEGGLRRLIVMLLQASFAAPSRRRLDGSEVWQSNSFCIRCGCSHKTGDIKGRLTRSNNEFWTLACSGCGMHVTRTHCFGCKSSVLFKNGLQLTYHRTVADQVTNIVCPACGEYFDSDVHGKREQ